MLAAFAGARLTAAARQSITIPEIRAVSRHEALKWPTRGMRKVSRHMADVEMVPIDVKVLLYPRNDLT
jgi:hypothetical protein